jgi:hypothetical protein
VSELNTAASGTALVMVDWGFKQGFSECMLIELSVSRMKRFGYELISELGRG